jgi:hypothetical protein
MGLFRALNLLQAVENQTTLGAGLESALSASPAQEAEFGAMLSTRHMARRMAGNPITMAAINLSEKAIGTVFTNTSLYNFRPIEEVAKNSGAMLSTATVLDSLTAAADNAVAWSYYSTSAFYEQNVWDIIVTLVGLTKADNASIGAMMVNVSDVADITGDARGIAAVIASPDAFEYSQSSSAATELYADSTIAMNAIIAGTAAIQTILAASAELMGDIASRPTAFGIVANSLPSVQAIAANATGWTSFLGSASFPTYLKEIITSTAGLDGTHASVDAIIADATALALVAANARAVQSLLSNSAAITTLTGSPNLAVFLGSSAAMAEITPNESLMNTLIADTTAFPILLTSADAKAAIFASATLLNTMLTGADSSVTIQGLAQTKVGPTPDTSIGNFQSLGLSGNVILLTGVMGSIVGTLLDNYFKGDTGPTDTIACPGVQGVVPPTAINKAYTNPVWDVNSIAATAAAKITVTYVDFN